MFRFDLSLLDCFPPSLPFYESSSFATRGTALAELKHCRENRGRLLAKFKATKLLSISPFSRLLRIRSTSTGGLDTLIVNLSR